MAIALLCLGCLLVPQSGSHVLAFGDDRIEVSIRGALGPRVVSDTAPKTGAKPRVWRTRVRIAADLRAGEHRTTMDAATVARIREAFAKFGRRVFAQSRGRVRIAADVAVLPAPLRVTDPEEPFWLTPTRERNCGVSGAGVDSVFLVFPPGRRELAMLAGTFGGDRGPDGAGSTGIAWVESREDEMVRTILHEWLHQVEWLARTGFGMPWMPGSHDREELGFVDEDRALAALLGHYLSAAFWRRAGIRERHEVQRLVGDRRWVEVEDDPWRRLPVLDEDALSKRVGCAVRLEVGRGYVAVRGGGVLNARLDLTRESSLALPVRGTRDRFVILVRGDRAELFGRFLRGRDAVVAGVLLPIRQKRRIDHWESGGTATPLAVFEATLDAPPRADIDLLAVPGGRGRPRPPDMTVELEPRSGPVAVVRADAAWVCRVRNNTKTRVTAALEVWVPPDVAVLDLPQNVTLPAGAARRLPCRIRVERERPAGPVEMRLVARGDAGVLGQVRRRVHVAVGRDFLRLDFEGQVLAMRPADRRETDSGDWTARRQKSGLGTGCIRVSDGGGSRFGRHHVMPPSPLSFDTEQFPHLTFYFRANAQKGARLAINLAVGSESFSIPLVGEFERAWDRRRPLPRAKVKLTGEWHRVAYDLDAALDAIIGDGGHRVSSIDFGDTRARCSNRFEGEDAWSFELDEFAVVRTPEETADDRLRYLTQRYRRLLSAGSAEKLRAGLADIDAEQLGAQGRVDHALLHHALEWQRVSRELPRKRRGRPAGRERYAAMLRHVHHLDETPEDLLRIGEEQVRSHQAQLKTLATKIAPGKTWRQVVELLKSRHPTAEELPKVAAEWMQRAIDFTVERELMTVPMAARDARIRVVTRGVLSRTYPFGGYGGARPSGRGFTGTYLVSPPADWMNEEQAEERLRGNHYAWTRVVALHEVVPGHHLQTVVHKMRPLSPFRRQFYSTVFGEGWAMHCEELLFRNGFFPDVDTRFTQLQMRLWRAARIVIDVSLHTGAMTMEEAEKFLVREVALDPINAKAEVARYIDNPTRPMSYLLGFLLIERMKAQSREALGERFSSSAFLDRILSFGPVPLPAVTKGMGL